MKNEYVLLENKHGLSIEYETNAKIMEKKYTLLNEEQKIEIEKLQYSVVEMEQKASMLQEKMMVVENEANVARERANVLAHENADREDSDQMLIQQLETELEKIKNNFYQLEQHTMQLNEELNVLKTQEDIQMQSIVVSSTLIQERMTSAPMRAASGRRSSSNKNWAEDSSATACTICNGKFTMVNRRHHCRTCGCLCCSNCGPKLKNGSKKKAKRICRNCIGSEGNGRARRVLQ